MYGGGAAEIAWSLMVGKPTDAIPSIEQYAMHALMFASALPGNSVTLCRLNKNYTKICNEDM